VRTILVGALAAILVGCSCPLRQQAGFDSCADANGLTCLDMTAASQPVEPKPVSFKTNSAPLEIKPPIAAKTEKPSSAHAHDKAHLDVKMAKSTMIAAKAEAAASRPPPSPHSLKRRPRPASNAAADSNATRANIADSHPASGAVANSNTKTMQEQVAAATAVAVQMTVATLVPAPESKANNKDRSDHSETVLRGGVETTAPAQPNKTDLLVYLVMARPEIKSVSDLTSKTIAIDDGFSAYNGIKVAIAAAGALDVQLSNGRTKAIDRVINGEVPAAVLTVVSQEAAEGFPDIAGFKIFRIPLWPRSSKPPP
jgi:hypothetical protein